MPLPEPTSELRSAFVPLEAFVANEELVGMPVSAAPLPKKAEAVTEEPDVKKLSAPVSVTCVEIAMPLPAPTSERWVAVAIVGGGVSGLSAGWKLAKAGFTVIPVGADTWWLNECASREGDALRADGHLG